MMDSVAAATHIGTMFVIERILIGLLDVVATFADICILPTLVVSVL